MKTFKELRKAKGLTMGKLAELSGVSAKTVSVYEQDPPARPSKKIMEKLAEALEVSMDELTFHIYPAKRPSGKRGSEPIDNNIILDDVHVNRLQRLIDKELEELRAILLEGAELTDDYPAIARCMDMVGSDIDLLTEIKSCFLG